MPTRLESLTQALTAPLLEAELSGQQIGRNRLRVIERLSEVLNRAPIQVWLVEQHSERVENRLAYWFPKPNPTRALKLRGNIIVEQFAEHAKSMDGQTKAPLKILADRAKELFQIQGHETAFFHSLPLFNPIPKTTATRNKHDTTIPLAWVFAAPNAALSRVQRASATAIGFNLSILLEHGRAHRILEATNKCTELLHDIDNLDYTLLECAKVLADSCASGGAGYVEFANETVSRIHYSKAPKLTQSEQQAISSYIETNIRPIAALRTLCLEQSNGIERHSNSKFGNLLYIPISATGVSLTTTEFRPLTAPEDGLGFLCEFHSHALFLTRKQSPDYLGLNFSATDYSLSRAVARSLSSAAFSKFFQQLFLAQTEYFASTSFNTEIAPQSALDQIQRIVPGATALTLVTIYRNTSGQFEVEQPAQLTDPISDEILEFLRRRSQDVYSRILQDRPEAIDYASYVNQSGLNAIIFQMSTRYVPLRFYILQLGTPLIEQFRIQLIKHFMRELYHSHRAKDISEERSSLLAQIRHAVVDPLAAATNNIEAYQKMAALYGRRPESWLEFRSNKTIRDLIPHAKYLNNQALLFIDTGRFLFSALTYQQIKFDQYKPRDLLSEVRIAFEFGLRERAQVWNVKMIGDSNRSAVGDKLLIWMALANLIDNAIKYGRRNTSITAIVEFRDDEWAFSIENIGDYLDPALAEDIFRPFVRGRSADTSITRRQGTGIGLTVAQMILLAHDDTARIGFQSKLNPGHETATTQFTFTLPYKLSKPQGL